MTSQNYPITIAEIDRDHRLLVLMLLRRLTAISTEQLTQALAGGRVGDPLELCRRIERLLDASRARYRRLNNARLNRRARAPRPLDDSNAPAPLHPFTRNGPYAGCFADMRALARSVLPADAVSTDLERYLDLDELALDLHLDGAVWTLDHDGKIHAFQCPRDDPGLHDRQVPKERRRRSRRRSSRKQ